MEMLEGKHCETREDAAIAWNTRAALRETEQRGGLALVDEKAYDIPEDLREDYQRAQLLADNGGYMACEGRATIPLIERIARLESEIAALREKEQPKP